MNDNRGFGTSRGYSARNAFDDKGSVGSSNRGGFHRGQSNGGNRGFGNSQGASRNDGRNHAYGQDSRRGNGFNQSAGGPPRYGNDNGNAPANVTITEEEKQRLLDFESTPITKPSPFAVFKKPDPLPNPNVNMGFFARPARPDAQISGDDAKPVANVVKQAEEAVKPVENVVNEVKEAVKPVENVVKQAEEAVKPVEDVTDQAEVIAKSNEDDTKPVKAGIVGSSDGIYTHEQMIGLSKAKESLVDPMVDTSFIVSKESEELLQKKASGIPAFCFPKKKSDECAMVVTMADAREPMIEIDDQDKKPESSLKEVTESMLKTMLGIGHKEATGEEKQSVQSSVSQNVVGQVKQLSSVASAESVFGLSKGDMAKLAVVVAKFSEAFLELNVFMQHMIR